VAEQHLGVPVKCGRCGRSFTTRVDTSLQPVRLDIGAASTRRFLAHHLVYWNLDERHELAVLVLADGPGLGDAAAALAPLLASFLNGTSQDTAGTTQCIAAACKNQNTAAIAIICDGLVSIGGVGECPIYHQRGSRLMRLQRDPVKLAAGDWLVLASADSQHPLDESALQREIVAATPSAEALAEHLSQGSSTIIAVRCY
jgi:hypothetical protein